LLNLGMNVILPLHESLSSGGILSRWYLNSSCH
jgi:hypothetical protein